jgi:hypothetical protein
VLLAALIPLVALAADSADAERPGRDPRAWGSVLLLVAAGLAHWLFMAVFVPILGLAALLLWPASRRQRSAGVPLQRTASGVLAAAAAAVTAAMAVLIGAVLRAPVDTVEVKEDAARFLPKLGNDAKRLALPILGPVAVAGGVLFARHARTSGKVGGDDRTVPVDAVLGWLLVAWTGVSLAGIAYGALTKDLPPHRFLELVVVVPMVLTLAYVVDALHRWVRGRWGRAAATVVAVAASAALAAPGAVAWSGGGGPRPWIDPAALQQAGVVATWSRTLPPGRPFVILVSPFGTAGTLSAALKERTVRLALPAERQQDVHLFVGTAAELAARRQPRTPSPQMNAAILPYWDDVRPVLASNPPVVVLRAFDPADYAALEPGGRPIGPGALLVTGPAGTATFEPPTVPDAFPGAVAAAAWTAVLLGLLFVAGLGWAVAILGPGAPEPVLLGMAPAVGAGALILAGTLASRAGAGLGGGAGVGTVAAVSLGGFAAATLRRRAP